MSTAMVADGPASFFVGVRFKPGEAIRVLDVAADENDRVTVVASRPASGTLVARCM
jgi:hypothetical protein